MPHDPRPSSREPLVDALRALALLSVLVVNAAGYLVAPWGPTLGPVTPADGVAATLVRGLVAALLQGKGYPLLAFVFGMALWYAMRRLDRPVAQRRGVVRQRRLLGLGVVHGLFVYFGDILTLYALVGWNLLRRVREPWVLLRQRLRRALAWAVAVMLVSLVLVAWLGGRGEAGDGQAEARLSEAAGWWAFWRVNGGAYLLMQVAALVLAWPVVRLCMLAGVAAARLKLLTHPRWQPLRQRVLRRLAWPVLLLNVAYGLGSVGLSSDDGPPAWLEIVGQPVGMALAVVYAVALAGAARGGQAAWCHVLAPLGSRTLTLYIVHGLVCALLFAGAGLGWRPGTVGMAVFALGLWALALLLARFSGGRRWPFEWWMARR